MPGPTPKGVSREALAEAERVIAETFTRPEAAAAAAARRHDAGVDRSLLSGSPEHRAKVARASGSRGSR